jgi:hypothetical protein
MKNIQNLATYLRFSISQVAKIAESNVGQVSKLSKKRSKFHLQVGNLSYSQAKLPLLDENPSLIFTISHLAG